MQYFKYTARSISNKSNEYIDGVITAEDYKDAMIQLASRGLLPRKLIEVEYQEYRHAKYIYDTIEELRSRVHEPEQPKAVPTKKFKKRWVLYAVGLILAALLLSLLLSHHY